MWVRRLFRGMLTREREKDGNILEWEGENWAVGGLRINFGFLVVLCDCVVIEDVFICME